MDDKKDFFTYISRPRPEEFWYFMRKVNERLTILFVNNLPNKMELEPLDEQMLREMYEWFCDSDLFQPSDEITPDEAVRLTKCLK